MAAPGVEDGSNRIFIPARTKSANATTAKQAARSRQGDPVDAQDLARRLEKVLAERAVRKLQQSPIRERKGLDVGEKVACEGTHRAVRNDLAHIPVRQVVPLSSDQSKPRPISFHHKARPNLTVDPRSVAHQRHTLVDLELEDEATLPAPRPPFSTTTASTARPSSVVTVQSRHSSERAAGWPLDVPRDPSPEKVQVRSVSRGEVQSVNRPIVPRYRNSSGESFSSNVPATSFAKAGGSSTIALESVKTNSSSAGLHGRFPRLSFEDDFEIPSPRDSIRLVPGPRIMTPIAMESPRFQAAYTPVESSPTTSPLIDRFSSFARPADLKQTDRSTTTIIPFPSFDEGVTNPRSNAFAPPPNFSTPNLRPLTPKSGRDSMNAGPLGVAYSPGLRGSSAPRPVTSGYAGTSDRQITSAWAHGFPSTDGRSGLGISTSARPKTSGGPMQQDQARRWIPLDDDAAQPPGAEDLMQAFKDFKLDLEQDSQSEAHDATVDTAGFPMPGQVGANFSRPISQIPIPRRDSGTLGADNTAVLVQTSDKRMSFIGDPQNRQSIIESDRAKSPTDLDRRRSRDIAGGQALLDGRARNRASMVVGGTLIMPVDMKEPGHSASLERVDSINDNPQRTGPGTNEFLLPSEMKRGERRERRRATEEAQLALQSVSSDLKSRHSTMTQDQPTKANPPTTDVKARRKSVSAMAVRKAFSIFSGNKSRPESRADLRTAQLPLPIPTERRPQSSAAFVPLSSHPPHATTVDTPRSSPRSLASIQPPPSFSSANPRRESPTPTKSRVSVYDHPKLILDLPLLDTIDLGLHDHCLDDPLPRAISSSPPRPTTAPAPRPDSFMAAPALPPFRPALDAALDSDQATRRRRSLEERKVRELAAELGRDGMTDASFKLLRDRAQGIARPDLVDEGVAIAEAKPGVAETEAAREAALDVKKATGLRRAYMKIFGSKGKHGRVHETHVSRPLHNVPERPAMRSTVGTPLYIPTN